MVRDLDMDIEIVVCPTIREKDGLAMSSRNAYLHESQRGAAGVLYKALQEASGLVKSGIINANHIQRAMKERILQEPAVSGVDYAGVYDPETLDELSEMKNVVLLAVAVKIGETRLIDNMLIDVKKER
jgi:pantoate--beta-alanine ligase